MLSRAPAPTAAIPAPRGARPRAGTLWRSSHWAHYIYLADAFLHGAGDRARLACATLTFALGTALHYGAAMGNVWLHAQITATALQVFALLAAANGWYGIRESHLSATPPDSGTGSLPVSRLLSARRCG